ncbi:MAG: helix-turn-helix domain-containing protein [Alphaproteobacteria bacterium]|nr:helix-turn-helix domain-containing protein [Alphaproteobacteria bacterium]
MNDINSQPVAVISAAIKRERERVAMSLSALAAKAGLAKSTLSQLEAGNGNPSIETLWAIATALDVPFSFLFEASPEDCELIRMDGGMLLQSDETDLRAVLLNRCPPARLRDIFRVQLRKGDVRHAKAHPAGSVEHVLLAWGEIRAGTESNLQHLKPGDYYRFPGDQPHIYECVSDGALFFLAMESRACA